MSSLMALILSKMNKRAVRGQVSSLGRAVVNTLGGLAGDSKGSILLETVIASMVFALVGTAVLAGLSTVYTSGSITETQSVSENVARNQMEFLFSQPYREPQQTPYPTMTGIPANYLVATTVGYADSIDPDPEVEKITVTARHDGQDIITLQTLRGRTDGLQLRYSTVSDRSNSVRLRGQTISGTVYVFLDDPELLVDDQAEFFLDSVAPLPPEIAFPWDFKGGDVATANPWDTVNDPAAGDGPHQIKAEILLMDGNTINVTADFTIDNP